MSRRLRVLEADIMSEKIVMEKSRIDEVEATQHVQRAAELRNQLQKELEEVEQKDTMAKFELFELKRVHEELQKSLTNMRRHNNQLVEPVLERLRKEVSTPVHTLSRFPDNATSRPETYFGGRNTPPLFPMSVIARTSRLTLCACVWNGNWNLADGRAERADAFHRGGL